MDQVSSTVIIGALVVTRYCYSP